MLVAAAGPASNLVWRVRGGHLLHPGLAGRARRTEVSVPVAALLRLAVQLNLLLAVFNIIPIPPLDGGNVLSGLLPRNRRVLRQIRPYGILLLYALVLTDGYDYLVVHRPSSFSPGFRDEHGARRLLACGRPDGCTSVISSGLSATGCPCRSRTTASTSSPTGMR